MAVTHTDASTWFQRRTQNLMDAGPGALRKWIIPLIAGPVVIWSFHQQNGFPPGGLVTIAVQLSPVYLVAILWWFNLWLGWRRFERRTERKILARQAALVAGVPESAVVSSASESRSGAVAQRICAQAYLGFGIPTTAIGAAVALLILLPVLSDGLTSDAIGPTLMTGGLLGLGLSLTAIGGAHIGRHRSPARTLAPAPTMGGPR